MASARLAISALFLVKKKFEDLKNVLVQDTKYRNWEIIDEGFHSLDSDRIEILKDIGSTYNVKYSVHAPFSSINIAEPDPRLSRFFTSFLEDSLQGSYTLGAEYFIIHPGRLTPFTRFFPEKGFSTLVTVLNQLLDTSKNLGVKIIWIMDLLREKGIEIRKIEDKENEED